MRPTLSATRALAAALRTPASKYTCAACRTFTSSTRAAAVLDTEKWRKKIWGTENPPGAKDPYSATPEQQYAAAKKAAKPPKAKKAPVEAVPQDMSSYAPAESWDGLQEVGGKGIWWMNRAEPEFEGFIPTMKLDDPYEITAALHRAVVEVFALRAAEVPLSQLGNAAIGPDVTAEVQIVQHDDGARLGLPDHITLEDLTTSLSPSKNETSVKTNPSVSEAIVAADRDNIDPMVSEKVSEAIDETLAKGNPSASEEIVAADRSGSDPLRDAAFQSMVESWDPVWLSVSLREPAVKFAVSDRHSLNF